MPVNDTLTKCRGFSLRMPQNCNSEGAIKEILEPTRIRSAWSDAGVAFPVFLFTLTGKIVHCLSTLAVDVCVTWRNPVAYKEMLTKVPNIPEARNTNKPSLKGTSAYQAGGDNVVLQGGRFSSTRGGRTLRDCGWNVRYRDDLLAPRRDLWSWFPTRERGVIGGGDTRRFLQMTDILSSRDDEVLVVTYCVLTLGTELH